MTIDRSEQAIQRDCNFRDTFVHNKLQRCPGFAESMDLTRFMHEDPARLLRCPACDLLLRDEMVPATYANDVYDSAPMHHLYPRYVAAFAARREQYESELPGHAEVVERGSHLGAFLEAAEQWGWRSTGLDIGRATCAFARQQGHAVKRLALEDYRPKLKNPDAIFIWNCFEQLEDPSLILRASCRLLNPHGLLLVRVPNAAFYHRLRNQHSRTAVNLLGYNNLLGFPYLHGYTPHTLGRFLRAHCFEPIATRNTSLIEPPYPEISPRINEEWSATQRKSEAPRPTGGPWIEIPCRKTAEPSGRESRLIS